jgi:hypothetical protein
LVDEVTVKTCSEWLELHPLTQDYFDHLIYENQIVLAEAYSIVEKIMLDEANIIDKVAVKTCSEWLELHPLTQGYLQTLINENIKPAQADYVIKKIIIDERGTTYKDLDVCAYDLWCDLKDIPGYFLVLARALELDPNSEIGKCREEKYQKSKYNLATMVNNKSIDWNRQKAVFKFSNVQDCKKWMLEKLTADGLIS